MSTDIRSDLVDRLIEHCSLPCVTGDEDPIASAVVDHYEELGLPTRRIGNSVVVGAWSGERPLVLLVGHLDVVPPTEDDLQPRLETRDDVDVVVGRGASDMKSGNVVAMSLLEDEALARATPYDIALVLYAGEEGPAEGNELEDVLADATWLREASLAVICEPTDGEVQAGCLGGIHALLTFEGRQAHSARPWHGENALTKAGSFLAELHTRSPREVEVEGVQFFDVWSATQANTDNARNVIPGRFVVNLNYRFAP
ncbi:MAG: M20/M25/M40 family metallo-hydrolase, partial [Nitriliruptorales bacterium]|nr:M20/M25/M40 family metallo-hydrolase [Nitriliruptorales bacterium]